MSERQPKNRNRPSLRTYLYSLGLGLVFFALLLLGIRSINFNVPGSFTNGSLTSFLISIVFFGVVFICIFAVVLLLFSKSATMISFLAKFDPLKKLPLSLEKGDKSFFIYWAIVYICWLPWIILAYPTDMNGDTLNQLWQYSSSTGTTWYTTLGITLEGELIDHHPIFDTLLFGLFLDLGRLLGSQNMGLFIYTVLQSLATSAALVLSCCYLSRLDVPKTIRVLLIIFIALFPSFAQFSAVMLKDSLFSLVFILYFLCILEMYRSKGSVMKNTKFLLGFITIVVLCVLTKKTGIFIISITGLVFLIAYREYFTRYLVALLTPLVVSIIIMPMLVFPALDVSPGGKQESLGPLFQQTAAFFINHPEEVTEEEYAIVGAILKPDKFEEKYKDNIVDPIKNTFDYYATTENIIDYLGVWAAQGLRHPETYLKATLKISGALLAPVKPITYYGTLDYSESFYENLYKNQGDAGIDIYKPEPIKSIAAHVKQAYEDAMVGFPLLTVLFGRGMWGCWIPLGCLLLCFFHQKRSLLVFVPIIMIILFLVISPAISARYILPLLYIAPLIIGFTTYTIRSSTIRESM